MTTMIRKLKRQTSETIFRFLSRLGQQAEVYSTHPEDLCPTLEDKCVYVYAKDCELVLVMIDTVLEGTQEQADLDFYNPLERTYFHNVTTSCQRKKDDKRLSPVWSLFHAATSICELVNIKAEMSLRVHALLITNSHIVNYNELRETIFHQSVNIGMTVIHDCQSFYEQWSVLKLPVNEDPLLVESAYLSAYKRELGKMNRYETDEMGEEEINQLLADFVNQEAVTTDRNDDSDDEGDSPFDDIGLDEAALTVSTRLAACRSLKERRQFLIRYAKQRFSERVSR